MSSKSLEIAIQARQLDLRHDIYQLTRMIYMRQCNRFRSEMIAKKICINMSNTKNRRVTIDLDSLLYELELELNKIRIK